MEYIDFIYIFITILIGIITFYKRKFTYWSRRNVPSLPPSIPFGSLGNLFSPQHAPGVTHKNFYLEAKSKNYKYTGSYIFFVPDFVALDLDLIKCVLQKDFHHFTERGFYFNEVHDPLSANLFTLGFPKWKQLRSKLSPTFTSGKMKMMFETILTCGDQLVEAFEALVNKHKEVDIKDVAACYTTDVIGSCAFGLNCNSFKTEDAEFRQFGNKLFEPLSGIRNFEIIFALFQPKIARKLGIRLFPKAATDFFKKVVVDTVEFRENSDVDRKDMLKILLDLKKSDDGISVTEIAAQALIFFSAGFETSSTSMTFCLYELSNNLAIQERVREEIRTVLKANNGKISYEAIKEMKYLHQVVQETLRKYPPLPFITRECVEDYRIPDTDAVIPKGVLVKIPIMGIHHDSEYYPNPDKFDPDRFLPEVAAARPHYSYMPFGEGPRICIGLRFGLLQTKIGLISVLRNYKFTVNKKTVEPIVFNKHSLILSSEKEIYLNVEKA